MERPPEHPGTLRFRSPELEEAFRLDNTSRMARYVRWPLLLGGVLFAGYGNTLASLEEDPRVARLRRTNDGFFLKLSYLFRL